MGLSNLWPKAPARLRNALRNAGSWLANKLARFPRTRPKAAPLSGPHDCALHALSEVAPEVDIDKMREAFLFCAKEWPYGGVTNREFHVALNFLG